MDNLQEKLKIKNPIIRFGTYLLLTMLVGIGAAWVLLGVISPILLVLLIQKW